MDFLQKIGGRKFLMALLTVGVAVVIELQTERGLSPTMATFLGSIVAAFSVANSAVTKMYMNSRNGTQKGTGDIEDRLDQISDAIQAVADPELTSSLTTLLTDINSSLQELKSTSGQVGLAVLNIGKEVQNLKSK